MIPDKILYTDGHNVVVTDSTFQVNNTSYSTKGIIKHGLMILRPQRIVGIIILLIGVALFTCGMLNLIPYDALRSIDADSTLNVNAMAMWTGLGLALVGILITGLMRERYAVRIATAEGEKNAVVSHKKEYITQIVNALNEALRFSRPGGSRHFLVVKE